MASVTRQGRVSMQTEAHVAVMQWRQRTCDCGLRTSGSRVVCDRGAGSEGAEERARREGRGKGDARNAVFAWLVFGWREGRRERVSVV